MKKVIFVLITLALCLSLCACVKREELEKYKKYETLINYMEAEDYEGALADLQNRIPAPEESLYSEVELTLENWDTYFEVVKQEQWITNGFGEAENYEVYYNFKVREEYLTKIKTTGINLTVELSYTANFHEVTVDLKTREVIIGEIQTNVGGNETGEVKEVRDIRGISKDGSTTGILSYLINWDDGTQSMYIIEDIPTATRIKGTIQLLAE